MKRKKNFGNGVLVELLSVGRTYCIYRVSQQVKDPQKSIRKPECKSLQYSTQAILIEWSHLSKLHPRYCSSLLIDNSLLSQRLFVISFSHFLLWWTLLFRFCYYWFSMLNLFVLCRSKWIEKLELQAKTDYLQVENCFLYWCHKSNATQMILIGTVNGKKAKKEMNGIEM